MSLHSLGKITEKRKWGRLFFIAGFCFVLVLAVYLFFLFFYPQLRNAPEWYSGEQWKSLDGSISFEMINKEVEHETLPSYREKPYGKIVSNGEVIPIRVTFRSHDPIMWVYKDTERVRASGEGYREDTLLKYECEYWRGEFKATLIEDYNNLFNGELEHLTFVRIKEGKGY